MRRVLVPTFLIVLALLLVACPGQQTAEPTEEPAVQPTEEPAAEPTATEAEAPEATPTTEEAEATPTEEDGEDTGAMGDIESVCLVTDVGRVNDGTFNEYAYNGMTDAVEDFDLDSDFIETQSQADYNANIQTCLDEGFDILVTVGFLIADATLEAAQNNPDTFFIGVDQFYEEAPDNLVGIQFREDQGGFLAGAMAGMMTESGVVGGIYGVDIPPVVKFRNGFEHGVQYVNPDAQILGVYIPSFTDPAQGASTAEQFIGEGADVIFGAGGPTGSGGIKRAAEEGIWVIGVDQDEYFTTFGGGDSPGADRLLTSAVKRVDVGVYNQIQGVVEPDSGLWAGGGHYILNASNEGISYAPFHEAEDDIPDEVKQRMEEVLQLLADEELTTGADPVTGEVVEDEIPEPVPYEGP